MDEKVTRLPKYYSINIRQYILSLDAYISRDWNALREKLLLEFKNQDAEQQIYTREFLINYGRVSKERKEDTKIYYKRFLASSKVIMLKGILDKPTAF